MNRYDKILTKMRHHPANVRFAELEAICTHFFGQPRNQGTSHKIYRLPWPGDPRVNIQCGHGGKAKAYQTKQALTAIEKYLKEYQ